MAQETKLSDVQWDSDGQVLVWLEGRSDRGVIVCRSPATGHQFDLTRQWNVRAGVGYGGGDFTVSHGCIYFIADNTLLRQPIDALEAEPLYRSPTGIASPTVSPDASRLAFIEAGDPNDQIRILPLSGDHTPWTVAADAAFCMQPAWHPAADRLVWVAWDHPHMPWDSTRVEWARLGGAGWQAPVERRTLLVPPAAGRTAYFQPSYSPDGRWLSVVSDADGWSNLQLFDAERLDPVVVPAEPAEHAAAPWIQGMRSYGWSPDSSHVTYIRASHAFASLHRLWVDDGRVEPLPGDLNRYTAFRQPSISVTGRLAVLASAYDCPLRLLTWDAMAGVRVCRRTNPEVLDPACFSRPEALHWPAGDTECHGLFWPPTHPKPQHDALPPLIIKIHGGPTSQYFAEYDADTLFFTSRGYAVLGLNHRGSSGYGVAYREQLREQWGVVDVEDVKSAADFLIASGRVDRTRLLLAGGSAGGFTLLLSLIRYPRLFRAGICRYGVSDLLALTGDTHKFEAHYLDSLIGPLPGQEARYRERSPATYREQIIDPLALFQGSADNVVPRSQADAIADSLASRGIPHIYKVYPGEGHGWRKGETVEDYYHLVEWFLQQHLDP